MISASEVRTNTMSVVALRDRSDDLDCAICCRNAWQMLDLIFSWSPDVSTLHLRPYLDDSPSLPKTKFVLLLLILCRTAFHCRIRSIELFSTLLQHILSRQNCLYLLRTVYSFLKQVSVSDVRLQKRNFGRKQQINVTVSPKLGFDARNFGQFSIKKKSNNCADIS